MVDKERLAFNELMRRWDMDMIDEAVDRSWISDEEARELRDILTKLWENRREDLEIDKR